MDLDEKTQRLLNLVHTMAQVILALPPTEREAWLQNKRREHKQDALSEGATDSQAQEWADNVDKWARQLVELIQSSGGAAGGNA